MVVVTFVMHKTHYSVDSDLYGRVLLTMSTNSCCFDDEINLPRSTPSGKSLFHELQDCVITGA